MQRTILINLISFALAFGLFKYAKSEANTNNNQLITKVERKRKDAIHQQIHRKNNVNRRFLPENWKNQLNTVYGKDLAQAYRPFFNDVFKVLSTKYGKHQADLKLNLYLDLKYNLQVSRGEIHEVEHTVDDTIEENQASSKLQELATLFPQVEDISDLKFEIEHKFESQKEKIFGETLTNIDQLIKKHNQNLLEAYGTTQIKLNRMRALRTHNRNGQEITVFKETVEYDTQPKIKIQF